MHFDWCQNRNTALDLPEA